MAPLANSPPPRVHQSTPLYDYYLTGRAQDAVGQEEGGVALMGGGTDVDEAFRFLLERGGGDVVILRASGADGYNDYLMNLGPQVDSVESLVLKDRQAASDPFVLEKVRQADVVFFAGGDQARYLELWRDTPLQSELQSAVERGVPVGGTSAGLAILGDTIFAARQGTVTSPEVLTDPYHPGVTLEGPFLHLDHLEGVLTDSHFSQRERMGRLIGFMARADQLDNRVRGLGVDEQTAVLLRPDGTARAVGHNAAYFVAAPGPAEVCEKGQPLTYRNLDVQKLSAGQGEFDFHDWHGTGTENYQLSVVNGGLSAP